MAHKKSDSDQSRIMMIGPSVQSRGGIASVISGYRKSGIIDQLNITLFNTHFEKDRVAKELNYVRSLIKIFLNIWRFDILHIHIASKWNFRRHFPIMFLASFLKTKFMILHLHGGMFDKYYCNSSGIERSMIRFAFRRADKVIVLSSEWCKKVGDFCDAGKLTVIPNGVFVNSDEDAIPLKQGKPFLLLFMGNLLQRKGVYDLIEAIRIVRHKCVAISLYLCGEGETQKVRERIRSMGLDETVVVPGWVEGAKKEELLNRAYLYILPSYIEGLPVSVLEAMATGCPVISTKIGGIPDILEDGIEGFLIEPGDVASLADSILTLLNDPSLWNRMARAAKKKVISEYSVLQTLDALKELYRGFSNN